MWYYSKDRKPIGPFDAETFFDLINKSEITSTTLVWKTGMERWEPASDVHELIPSISSVPPPIPEFGSENRQDEADLSGLSPGDGSVPSNLDVSERQNLVARPWPRFLARVLDITLIGAVLFFGFGTITINFFPGMYLAFQQANDSAIGLLALPVIQIATALVMATFGSTFGKWLFGVRVENVSGLGRLRFHLGREISMWVRGLGLGIPIVAIFTEWRQYKLVAAGMPASYDVDRARVVSIGLSWWRFLLGLALLTVISGALTASAVYETEQTRAAQGTRTWANPITGKTALFSATWSVLPDLAENVYHFSSNHLLAEAVIGYEELNFQFANVGEYTSALERALAPEIQISGPWRDVQVGDRSGKRAYAISVEDKDVDIQVTVTSNGVTAWRTIVFARGRKADDLGEDFINAAFSTF